MTRDSRYDILFEPVQIGPVTARNRFYQVPHCNGMGRTFPSSMAEMRGIKAEGGWAVVCTEETEIHHTSEHSPAIEGRLWDDKDIPVFAKMNDKIHEHGSLSGVELAYAGIVAPNRYSREIPMAPSPWAVEGYDPVQARQMNRRDIKAVRQWHVDAAIRARKAGFDIIYVYAAHNLSVLMHFLSRQLNHRTDEYGGCLENRLRLFREVLDATKEAVGDTCAIAVRFAVDELQGPAGITCSEEGRDVVEILAELPDLWDVNAGGWDSDSSTSRFSEQGNQEDYVAFVKKVTTRPVVTVGRYTSPDAMVSLVKRGITDFIGAARPSIADPFLPRKIEEGRSEEIRECIGCNICVSGDFQSTPIRCTQNPTMGEEWRRGWHPDRIKPKASDASVLIVGGGPAGLECARALGQRGYTVTVAEAADALGGRVSLESRLPGLSEWSRVRDHRELLIRQMPQAQVYLGSELDADTAIEFAPTHVVLATGSKWRSDGVGRHNRMPVCGHENLNVFTPDHVHANRSLKGPVLVFDDDHYYMGGVIAEKLRNDGHEVIYVTPAADVSHWTHNTLEQGRIQKRLLELGINIVPHHNIARVSKSRVLIECVFTGRTQSLSCASIVMVTMRLPSDQLYEQLTAQPEKLELATIKSVMRIGDCLAPGTIAAAVYSGHRYARELDETPAGGTPFKRELTQLAKADYEADKQK